MKYPLVRVAVAVGNAALDPLLAWQPILVICVKPTYPSSVASRNGQYNRGRCVKPSAEAMGEYGNQTANAMMTSVVSVSAQLARLCSKGLLLVRMTWMMSVCVISDSTN
jgi:hypothetical protein